MRKLTAIAAAVLGLAWLAGSVAMAQQAPIVWDAKNYTGLVDATAPDTIPIGTEITVSNWQQYKRLFCRFRFRQPI